MKRHTSARQALALLIGALGPAGIAQHEATAQGCEPIRFTTPVNLGGGGQAYQAGHEWQVTLAYRRLASDQWFIGTNESSALAPGGQSPEFRIHTFIADVAYAIDDRFSVRLSVPISRGSLRTWPNKVEREQHVTGIGDLSLMGEAWLLAPRAHERGNIAVGLGFKAPTGSHTLTSRVATDSGAVYPVADQTIQPGDGGWAVLLQAHGFRQITERSFAYAFGSYMVSPKARSDVRWNGGDFWSVPDVYSARLGGAYSVMPDWGLTLSLGGRVDGIPVHDLLGGGDEETVKRSAYILFADPGLSLARGRGTFTLSVPYRLHVNREKSLLEQRTGALNAGGFARYLVFAGYAHRL